MNLLWLDSAVPTQTMTLWVTPEGRTSVFFHSLSYSQSQPDQHIQNRAYDNALSSLSKLHILSSSPVKLALNSTFKASLRNAIVGGYAAFIPVVSQALLT